MHAVINQKERQLGLINNDRNNLLLKQKEMFDRLVEKRFNKKV